MTKSPESKGKKKKQPGRVSLPSRTSCRTGEDGLKRPHGHSETRHLTGSSAEPSSDNGHRHKSVSDVEEGGMHLDPCEQTINRYYTSPPSPSESKSKTSIYPYTLRPLRNRDVVIDKPPCVEPSEAAPVAVAELFSRQMRRNSATSNYLRGDLITVSNIPGESNLKPMSRRNSFSSELLKKCAPMNENLRKNSSGNLTKTSSNSGPLRSNDIFPLRRRSSSTTHRSRRNSSVELDKVTSRPYTSGQNDCWDGSGKQREILTSLQLQETYRAAAKTLGLNHGKQSDVRNSPYHHLEGDHVVVTTDPIVPSSTIVGVNHKHYKIMPSQERMRSSPVTETDPVQAATELIEKYSKEIKGSKMEEESLNLARKSPLPKGNSIEATSDLDGRNASHKNRRDSSATEQLLRNYAKQKRRSSAHHDHRLHEGRYRRLSAHSSKTDPRSRPLKQQQALIKKIRAEVSEGEKRNKKLQASSSHSNTSDSQSDHTSQSASIEQKSIDDLTKRKPDGGFVEIDLRDANTVDPHLPSFIEIKEQSKEKGRKELDEVSKNKSKKSKRRSNETKSTVEHLYDSVDLDDPIIGFEIPLPTGNRRKEKQKRMTIQRGSFKKLTTHNIRKIVMLSFVGLVVVLSITLLLFFLVPRGGQKSISTPPDSGIHLSLENSGNETQLIVPENIVFLDTPIVSNHSVGAAYNVDQIQPKDFVKNPSFSYLQQLSGSATMLPNSPQFKASYWLLEHDSLQVAWNDVRFKPRYGLATLYYALNGDEWIKAEHWLGDGDFCTWHGVCCLSPSLQSCEKVFDGHGIDLRLENNNLRGAIPEEISLIELVVLDLARNEISGTLPSTLRSLSMLTNLHLDSNHLNGPIASDSWNATSLVELSMHDNLFSGTFPTFVEELHMLEVLDLGANQLSSTIPNIFGRLASLKKIDLGSNKLWGEIPETMLFLNELAELSLFENLLNGTLKDGLFQIRTLQILKLHTNNFSGTLPASIGECAALESLQLHHNSFFGTIPSAIGKLTSLNNLYLDDNNFIGSLPPQISKLSALRYFDADGNTITGEIPLGLFGLTSLRGLNLGRNRLTGSLPSGFNEQFSQLEYLMLDQNEMIGSIESSLWQMKSLKTLDLHQNSFSGSMPKGVGADSLQVIDLDGNNLQGEIPNDLLMSPDLKVAYLRSNSFFGTVDESICNSKNLEQLFMDCTNQIECFCCEKCA